MYEPDEVGLRGHPVNAIIKGNAMDEKMAKKQWDFAEQASVIIFHNSQEKSLLTKQKSFLAKSFSFNRCNFAFTKNIDL